MIFPNKEEIAVQDFSWRDCAFSDSKYEKGMCEISMLAVAEIIFPNEGRIAAQDFPICPPEKSSKTAGVQMPNRTQKSDLRDVQAGACKDDFCKRRQGCTPGFFSTKLAYGHPKSKSNQTSGLRDF